MKEENKTESKWREEIKSFIISILDAENQKEENQAIEEFELVISRIEKEAYEKGKEDMDDFDFNDFMHPLIKRTREVTLEEVEKNVKSKNVFIRGWDDSNQEEELETMIKYQDFLQTIKEMKK